ncbi:MAG TPA: MobF family relaxase [Rhodocyclaceae bacterium]
MLSIAIVKNSAAAGSYYVEADDYYVKDRSPSAWMGDGARRLGLSGEVEGQAFRDLLDGKMPDGSQIHNAAEGRRAGLDLTFSSPKSVSMQTLIGGDTRLVEAHEAAVARALDYAEGLAAYRVTEHGTTRIEGSGNLLVASFRHDLSREADPQLHTHAVAINATQRPDGEWRALEAGELLRQKMLMGALYRAELALEVQKLGYEVRQTHVDGRFELAHFDDKQIEAFSTRSQAIETALAKAGKTREDATAREKEIATLATRNAKGAVDRAALREAWQEKSRALGIDFTPALAPTTLAMDARAEAARAAVAFAVIHATERQAVVRETELIRAALERGTGDTDLAAIRAEIERQSRSGALIREGLHYTTPEAQAREREMLDIEARGRGVVAPILARAEAERALAGTTLNAGQRDAAALVVSTDARVSAIQGTAGTGKTTMLRQAQALAKARGYQMVGLAPSAAAARELRKAGIESRTIAAFVRLDRPGIDRQSILVVDEAGMVSARDMHQVLTTAEAAGARVVLVGDVQQLKAVEAGRPFAQLQAAGIARVEMGEIQRQNNAKLRHAVELAAKGEAARSLGVLSKHVVEIEDHRDRHLAIAKDYAMLPTRERDKTLILAGTHLARMAINSHVRTELGLVGRGVVVSALERKDLTEAQARSSLAYQPGDLVQAQKGYGSLGLARGDLARVVEGGAGRVMLALEDGRRVEWRPAVQTNLTAYRETARELAVGDAVRITANDHARGLVNGERATVAGIDAERQTVTLVKADGGEITLDASRPLHLDHGYCSTVHAAQGQTAERVLIEADTHSATANESSYYVAISRAREDVTIYTDDKAMLPEAMAREDEKSAALDVRTEREPVQLEL